MRNLPSLVVSAVSTWDGKALAKGEKQIGGFEKGIKGLGKAIGAAFSVTAILAFGKASVKAFAEDEKAAVRLTRTVNNLGLGFENTRITKFIADLEKTANVSDDVLRPAFSALLTTTGSVEKSQKMLALALDVAAGSGEDVTTVANDLAAAYVGNTKGLSKYRLGLTKAELAGKGFNEIQELLNAQFSGQNAARLDTYEGKMAALTVSFGNMQEIIGKGLVEAFALLAGDGGIEGATSAMEEFGQTASDALVGAASYLDKLLSKFDGLRGMSGGFDWLQLVPIVGSWPGIVEDLATEGRKVTGRDKQYGGRYADIYNAQKEAANAKARAKAEADAAKRQKELLALQKKSAIAEKNKLSLSKAAAVFDSTRISIAAALQATYDKETRLRLEALMAIENDQGDLALRKINELAALQKNADLAKLAGITTIGDAALQELNTRLITELKVINDSKMAEGDKELAREEAFKKYNAALVAAGGLAEKNSYDERTQIQLTEVARLASLSKTTSAANTATLLRESAELNMIDRVSAAQKKADEARLKALQEYLALLNSIGAGGKGSSGSSGSTGGNTGGSADKVLPGTYAGVSIKEATDAVVYFGQKATDAFQTVEDSGAFNALVNAYAGGAINPFNAGEFRLNEGAGYSGLSRGGAYDRDIVINVSAGVISQPDEFVGLVQETIQKLNRSGDPLTTAGIL